MYVRQLQHSMAERNRENSKTMKGTWKTARAFLWSLLFVATLNGCEPNLSDDPIPIVAFPDIIVNLNLPEYNSLKIDGGYYALNNGGVRGILLYRLNAVEYIAYERNCSYRPNESCSTVDVHQSGLYIFDACCGSSFDLATGMPTGGPAWKPLRRYKTSLQGNELTIVNEIVNG